MDTYHMYTDCTSLSLCSYQYISTRCLEVASSGHVALHGPEVGVEHLLGASAQLVHLFNLGRGILPPRDSL